MHLKLFLKGSNLHAEQLFNFRPVSNLQLIRELIEPAVFKRLLHHLNGLPTTLSSRAK